MRNVVIFGSGGHSKVIADILSESKEYNLIGLIESTNAQHKSESFLKILGTDDNLEKLISSYSIYGGIIGVADNSIRSKIAKKAEKIKSFKFINCIHPNAVLSRSVKIGFGNAFMAGSIINCGSTIANHCILNSNSSIDHDCKLEDFTSVAPNGCLGGNVTLGKFSSIGIGANIFNNIKIGKNCIVGGGSLVNKDTDNDSVYYGVPSIKIRDHKFGDNYI